MSAPIAIISTTKALTKRIHLVLNERKMKDIPVYELTMDDALYRSLDLISKGTRIIISRGGTAEYLRSKLDVPVVDIRHNFLDVYLSVKSARKKYKKVAIIGYANLCYAANWYKRLMNDKDLTIVEVKSTDEYEIEVLKLIGQGVEVLLGGMKLERIARNYNLDFGAGEVDEMSIHYALDEALQNLKSEEEQRKQYQTIETILNSTSDGVIGINKQGEILRINSLAKQILKYDEKKSVKDITKILPSEKILDTATTGRTYTGELITLGSDRIVVNSVPIIWEDEVIGAVATITHEDQIHNIDLKIRKKILGKGHIAKNTFSDIVGTSDVMCSIKEKAKKFAKTDSTILISGETGTGKEIFAQSIHNSSKRADQPFVAINCGALSESVLISELFGYVRGAFTGAKNEGKAGIFELAHNGTVFLDEISELPLDVQVKLLRVLQEKEVSRLGDDKVTPVNIRVLAASNKNLVDEINKGNFREDLYYRICVLEIHLPPLRERANDISLLVDFFIQNCKYNKVSKIEPESMKILREFNWPGNVRQLSNIMERLMIVCENGVIKKEDVEDSLKNLRRIHNMPNEPYKEQITTSHESSLTKDKDVLMQMEKETIIRVLRETGGNKEMASVILGMSLTTLWRRMKKYNIQ